MSSLSASAYGYFNYGRPQYETELTRRRQGVCHLLRYLHVPCRKRHDYPMQQPPRLQSIPVRVLHFLFHPGLTRLAIRYLLLIQLLPDVFSKDVFSTFSWPTRRVLVPPLPVQLPEAARESLADMGITEASCAHPPGEDWLAGTTSAAASVAIGRCGMVCLRWSFEC